MGYRTRRDSKFTDASLSRHFTDPIVIGKRRVNYTQSTGDGKHWVLKPEKDWIYIEAPAIVSEDLYWECRNFLDKQLASRRIFTTLSWYKWEAYLWPTVNLIGVEIV